MSLIENLIDESVSCGRCGIKGVGNCPCWNRKTILSEDRVYRYTLWREWRNYGRGKYANFIGLNPSTADESRDDATIRRCVNFAKAWGYDALCMTNLFAFRATDPRDMKGAHKPIGPENDMHLVSIARSADIVIAAWGVDGQYIGRDEEAMKLLGDLYCLGVTKAGFPKHPVRLSKTITPIGFPDA